MVKDLIKSALYDHSDSEGYVAGNESAITATALKRTVPYILKRELNEKQYRCIELFYYEGLSQREIADKLNINQSTVSRCIQNARRIVGKSLSYCMYSVNQANEQWLKTM